MYIHVYIFISYVSLHVKMWKTAFNFFFFKYVFCFVYDWYEYVSCFKLTSQHIQIELLGIKLICNYKEKLYDFTYVLFNTTPSLNI